VTGHRTYSVDQLPRLHRIRVLKELGFALEQITTLIDAQLTTDQLRGMLALKEEEARQQVDAQAARLARIRFHIRQLDTEASLSQMDIRIKHLEPLHVLSLRFRAANHLHLARVWAEIRAAAQAQSVRGSGHPLVITYADEYVTDDIDTECMIPVDAAWTAPVPLATFGTMSVREMDGIEAATYLHTGSPDTVNDGLVDLQRWVAAHGFRLGGSLRMVYLRGLIVPLPSSEWMFEMQHPLQKV
jgi:DNA-binding transcriptional MerR regulator